MDEFDWDRDIRAADAASYLTNAGYAVTETETPGLFDVAGIGTDITMNQLMDLAARINPSERVPRS